jgi:acetylornithine deacetylase/succinyl-diaminopimelate desuccinylase-like protein
MEKLRNLGNKLDANTPHLFTGWRKPYNPKNSYDNFNVLNNRKPVEQFIVNIIPDYVKLTYNCSIQTYYVEQLNKIIEAVNYASDSYWGDPERFKFKASIDSYDTPLELVVGQDRLAKATFSINLLGHIIPDNIQKEINSIRKYNSKAQVIITYEMSNSIEELNKKLNRH